MAYRVAMSQLLSDGYPGAALQVSLATCTPMPKAAAPTLTALIQGGAVPDELLPAKAYGMRGEVPMGARPVARFSGNGKLLAIGAADGTVTVMKGSAVADGTMSQPEATLRRYASHTQPVNDVEFHPTSPIVVSASEDATLHFYDTAAAHAAGPSRMCTDTHPARSTAFHPKGDHLLVGTTHAALHLYDMATFRCYLAADATHHHRAAITDARWSADGSMLASCPSTEPPTPIRCGCGQPIRCRRGQPA
jgi:hypothetical protein